jgi:hypothetical protein
MSDQNKRPTPVLFCGNSDHANITMKPHKLGVVVIETAIGGTKVTKIGKACDLFRCPVCWSQTIISFDVVVDPDDEQIVAALREDFYVCTEGGIDRSFLELERFYKTFGPLIPSTEVES